MALTARHAADAPFRQFGAAVTHPAPYLLATHHTGARPPMSAPMSAPVSATRIEEDALGEVHVPADHLWGAQTERSCENFPIGVDRFRFTRPVIRAFGILKQAAARANQQLGQLPQAR